MMNTSKSDFNAVASLGRKAIIPLAILGAISGSLSSCYNSNQHSRRVWAEFRNEVIKDQKDRLIAVKVDGVTREGNLNIGAAVPTGSNNSIIASSLIVAASSQAKCWYSTLRVTGGSDQLPMWQKIFGGDLSETYYINPAFSNENCIPLPDSFKPAPQ